LYNIEVIFWADLDLKFGILIEINKSSNILQIILINLKNCLFYKTLPPSLPVFRFFFAEPLLGNVLLDPGPVAFSLFFHRFNISVFLIKWKYIVTEWLYSSGDVKYNPTYQPVGMAKTNSAMILEKYLHIYYNITIYDKNRK